MIAERTTTDEIGTWTIEETDTDLLLDPDTKMTTTEDDLLQDTETDPLTAVDEVRHLGTAAAGTDTTTETEATATETGIEVSNKEDQVLPAAEQVLSLRELCLVCC